MGTNERKRKINRPVLSFENYKMVTILCLSNDLSHVSEKKCMNIYNTEWPIPLTVPY